MKIRRMSESDAQKAHKVFYDAVHAVDETYYSAEQKSAWAPEEYDEASFCRRVSSGFALVAVDTDANGEETIVAYGNIDESGYIDHLYVTGKQQGKGIGNVLCDELENYATEKGVKRLTVHASLNAKEFFLSRGYKLVSQRKVVRKGIEMVNYLMEKPVATEV